MSRHFRSCFGQNVVSEKETTGFNRHYQCFEVVLPVRYVKKVFYSDDFTSYLPMNLLKPIGVRTPKKLVCNRFDIDIN